MFGGEGTVDRFLSNPNNAVHCRYDGDKTGTIDFAEMALLFSDIGESLDAEEIKTLVTKVGGAVIE